MKIAIIMAVVAVLEIHAEMNAVTPPKAAVVSTMQVEKHVAKGILLLTRWMHDED